MESAAIFFAALCMLICAVHNVAGLIEGLYCGKLSCYEGMCAGVVANKDGRKL